MPWKFKGRHAKSLSGGDDASPLEHA